MKRKRFSSNPSERRANDPKRPRLSPSADRSDFLGSPGVSPMPHSDFDFSPPNTTLSFDSFAQSDEGPTTSHYVQAMSLGSPKFLLYEVLNEELVDALDDAWWEGPALLEVMSGRFSLDPMTLWAHSVARYYSINRVGRQVPWCFRFLPPSSLKEKEELRQELEMDKMKLLTSEEDSNDFTKRFPMRPTAECMASLHGMDDLSRFKRGLLRSVLSLLEQYSLIRYSDLQRLLTQYGVQCTPGRWVRETFFKFAKKACSHSDLFQKKQIGKTGWVLYEAHPFLTSTQNEILVTVLANRGTMEDTDDIAGFEARLCETLGISSLEEGDGDVQMVDDTSAIPEEEGESEDGSDADNERASDTLKRDALPNGNSVDGQVHLAALRPPPNFGPDFTQEEAVRAVHETGNTLFCLVKRKQIQIGELARVHTLALNIYRRMNFGKSFVRYPDIMKREAAVHRTHLSTKRYDGSLGQLPEYPSGRTANKSLSQVEYEMGSSMMRIASGKMQQIHRIAVAGRMRAENYRTLTTGMLDGVDINQSVSTDYPSGIWEGTIHGPRHLGDIDEDEVAVLRGGLNEHMLQGKFLASIVIHEDFQICGTCVMPLQ